MVLVGDVEYIIVGNAQMGGFAPLHYSSGLHHKSSVAITQLLLTALADPDVRAADDDSYVNRFLVCLIPLTITHLIADTLYCLRWKT